MKTENELWNAVFRFRHKAPSHCQEAAECETNTKHFAAFVADLKAVEVDKPSCGRVDPLANDRVVPAWVFTVHDVETLKEVCRRLSSNEKHERGDVWYDPWLPKYGCAIQRTMLGSTVVKLEVIFVDGWEGALHFLPTGDCIHGSVPNTHHVWQCADLDSDLVEDFKTAFDSKLSEAKQTSRSERSAATNELGHQKTPAFIAAVVRCAVASVTGDDKKRVSPQGGTTDVGQHTGGRPRDTCWSLVKAAIKHNLCCGEGLFRKTMIMLKLSLLQTAATEAEAVFSSDSIDVHFGCELVDDMFFMLQVIIQNVVEILGDGYDVSELQDRCTTLRSSIDGFVNTMNSQTASQYVLPSGANLEKLCELSCGVEMASPKRDTDQNSTESIEDRRRRARVNLGECRFLDVASCSLDNLLEWVNSNGASVAYESILVMRTTEAFMFAKSTKLVEDEPDERDHGGILERMQSLVTVYQETVCKWRKLSRMTSILNVEQRSREMLVIWVAFCLVHRECVNEVPLCAEYNIALAWKDLKVCVLSDRAAVSAVQRVAKYIRGWNEKTRGCPLFHLTDQKSTFEFALKFARSSPDMNAIYTHIRTYVGSALAFWRRLQA